MGILIGMDEAGYGPNFGPLVVAATAWHVPDATPTRAAHRSLASAAALSSLPSTAAAPRRASPLATRPSPFPLPKSALDAAPDLYGLLGGVIVNKPSTRHIAIADSKTLYTAGTGLAQLERGLHAAFFAIGRPVVSWSQIIACCQADPEGHHTRACWPEQFDCSLPVDVAADELPRLGAQLSQACQDADIRPLLIRARLICPAQLNDLVAHHGSKGAALSHITVGLLREVMDTAAEEMPQSPTPSSRPPTCAVCDKHGARNFYAALLQHHFSEHWIEPMHESREESCYEWGPPESRTRVAFRMNGERFLPTALASMLAKYLRELAMRAFNEFWAAHVPNLRPTAGYPQDARRFREDIRSAQQRLGIDDHCIWRNR